MPLKDIELSLKPTGLPEDVAEFLREADLRVDEFTANYTAIFRGFVPCDYVTLYYALSEITHTGIAAGNSFCEWGSGLGVVASLAAMLGLDAHGIEIDRDLSDGAIQLAEDFGIPADFINGSFVPQGADDLIDEAFSDKDGGLSLDTQADDAYEELGLDVCDFDIIFAFPWPDDEELTAEIFERFASRGALLLTYNDTESVRLRRKH